MQHINLIEAGDSGLAEYIRGGCSHAEYTFEYNAPYADS